MQFKITQIKEPQISSSEKTGKMPLLWFFLLTLILVSCEQQEGNPSYMGYDYFGFEEGKWIVYDVDSTVYDDFLGEVFHYQYQVMEINAELFTDAEQEESMRQERFIRQDENHDWEIKNIWSSKLNSSHGLRTEENVTFLKLIFPAKINQSWNGNAFNHQGELDYLITEIHQPLETGDQLFDSTLTIMQNDFETLISKELQYEIYAAGVGMVMKKFEDLEKEIDGTITRGVDYTYTIRDYGNLSP
ncbi:MAG: hypothetical protein ACLFQS_00145 [Bacteroidales bacterium]